MNIYKQDNTKLNNNAVLSLNSVDAQNNSYTENTIEQVVKQKILSFIQEQEFKAGDEVTTEQYWYYSILSRLNTAELAVIEHVWTTLVCEGYFDYVNGVYVLSELGKIAISDESKKVIEVVAHRILKFVREQRLAARSNLPVKDYSDFSLGLSSAERDALTDAWAVLVYSGCFDPKSEDYYFTQLGQVADELYTKLKQEVKHKIIRCAKAHELKKHERLNYRKYETFLLEKLSIAERLLVRDAWADLSNEGYFHPVDSSHYLTELGYQALCNTVH